MSIHSLTLFYFFIGSRFQRAKVFVLCIPAIALIAAGKHKSIRAQRTNKPHIISRRPCDGFVMANPFENLDHHSHISAADDYGYVTLLAPHV